MIVGMLCFDDHYDKGKRYGRLRGQDLAAFDTGRGGVLRIRR